MHRKLIDTLELIIKKKTEGIVNKGQNKKQKAKSNRPQQKTIAFWFFIENANYCSAPLSATACLIFSSISSHSSGLSRSSFFVASRPCASLLLS